MQTVFASIMIFLQNLVSYLVEINRGYLQLVILVIQLTERKRKVYGVQIKSISTSL